MVAVLTKMVILVVRAALVDGGLGLRLVVRELVVRDLLADPAMATAHKERVGHRKQAKQGVAVSVGLAETGRLIVYRGVVLLTEEEEEEELTLQAEPAGQVGAVMVEEVLPRDQTERQIQAVEEEVAVVGATTVATVVPASSLSDI